VRKKKSGIAILVPGGGSPATESTRLVSVVSLLLAGAGVLSGCTNQGSGTHVELNPEDSSWIKRVGVSVNVERGFAVRLQYVTNADQLFIGNLISGMGSGVQGSLQATGGVVSAGTTAIGAGVGAGIAAIGEFSYDKRATRAMNSEAAKMKSADAIGGVLVDSLRTARVFPEVELLSSQPSGAAQENCVDTLFVVTVRKWGLRPPLESKYRMGNKAAAQLELDVNLKLVSSGTGKVLWESDEYYMDSKCYTLGDFKSRQGLLVSRMELALQKVCEWTANEIHRVH
jgi:hypothetical protein